MNSAFRARWLAGSEVATDETKSRQKFPTIFRFS